MNLNIAKTVSAYVDISSKMEYLTKQVHEYVLVSGFLKTNRKGVLKAVASIADRNEELLVQTFIPKLCNKLPALRMGIKLGDFDQKRAKMIAAGIITQILIDNGSIPVDKRVEPVFSDHGPKKFHTRLYLQLGGSYEKDLFKGIQWESGVCTQTDINGWKLSKVEKDFLRKVASVPFQVSQVCTKELLMKGYSLKVDWGKKVDKNGNTLPEDPIVRKKRYSLYADTIIDTVQRLPAFYLSAKYCDRKRVYYDAARLDGIRPHGKMWETLMIDSAEAFVLSEEDERVLKHIIYVTLHGRVSVAEANDLFSLEDLLDAQSIDPMEAETEAEFGNAILLNKCYEALMDYKNGILSRFMFGYDFTNSGLIMSGVSFNSPEMMDAANIGGDFWNVVDSHTAFGDGYGLDLERKDIKGLHMGLMHGETLGSIAVKVAELTGEDCSTSKVRELNQQAYGSCVHNISDIAEWGTKVVGNEQSVLRWTMPDGFSASSKAYLKGVPVHIYCASGSHKEGYTSHVIVSDMPWLEDRRGFPVYGKETLVAGTVYPVEQKKRGLFASLTHGIDAYVLRVVATDVIDSGRPILLKHDNFIAMPSSYGVVKHAAKCVLDDMFQTNLYQEAINEIADNSPYGLEPLELVEGDADFNVWSSENFLMP